MSEPSSELDFERVKQAQRQMWSAGDVSKVATSSVIVGEELCEAVDVLPGERVLDVACGSGNATLAAARRAWNGTVGVDYVAELLERGRERAKAERLDIQWVVGDAERLPFEDGSFDVVLSVFGAMFAPHQRGAATELLRVCRPGGRIGMANWTPDGAIGELFEIVGRHAPPPPGIAPPSLWGSEDHLRELLGEGVSSLVTRERALKVRFFSADHFVEFFRTYFGPVKLTFERLDEDARTQLTGEVKTLLDRLNRAGRRALVFPAEYLEVVALRR